MSQSPRGILDTLYSPDRQRIRPIIAALFGAMAVLFEPGPMAVAASADSVRRGGQLFLGTGCGACHRVRGTAAQGAIGPDLTHVGSRMTIGAGLLPNTEEALASFIARPDRLKSGIKMPNFDMLPKPDIEAIAAYLKALR
jgi:cytochrome c oxidase subunit 2